MDLRAFREKLGLNQAQAARAAGVSAPALCSYELGRRFPDPETMLKLMAWSIDPKTGRPQVTERDILITWVDAQGQIKKPKWLVGG